MIKQNNIPTVKLLHGLIEENKISEFENLSEIWVFGYGSLVWLPKFEYTEKVTGYVTGYDRRFYQGNSTHRGVPGKPGRVATLLRSESPTARTYGAAYRLVGREQIQAAMEHLNMRESTLGGYILEVDQFTTISSASPTDGSSAGAPTTSTIPVVFYVATAENDQFTGHESLEVLALIIATSVGPSGPNRDYLFNLAKWQKEALPMVEDDHLYRLEKMTQRVISAYQRAPTYHPMAAIMAKSTTSSWSNPSPVAGRRRNSFIADKAVRSRL